MLAAIVLQDAVTSHQKFRDKYSLPFPLLADTETKAAQAYGIWKEKSLYGRKYMGMERTTFVITPNGKIIATLSSADDGIKPADHVEKSLAIVQKLAQK